MKVEQLTMEAGHWKQMSRFVGAKNEQTKLKEIKWKFKMIYWEERRKNVTIKRLVIEKDNLWVKAEHLTEHMIRYLSISTVTDQMTG